MAFAIVFLLLVFAIMILFNPVTYAGGQSDDGRYIETAWAWIAGGPQLGQTHWALRWPVYIDAIAALKLWGPNRALMMAIPLLGWLLTLLILSLGVHRKWGTIAAFGTALAFITTPQMLISGVRIGADLRELLFWAASLTLFLSACGASEGQRALRLAACGVMTALAFATRETSASLLLIYGLVFLDNRMLPRRQFLWIAIGFLVPFIAEYSILFAASGDPLWRLHVDMNHVNIPTGMLDGLVANSDNPLGRFEIASRWLYPGPINIWWPINPFLNIFVRGENGFVCILTAALLLHARLRGLGTRSEWQAIKWLVLAAVIQMGFNVFIVVTDPQPRMFLPALAIACTLFGLVISWHVRDNRLVLLLPIIPLMIIGGLRGMDEVDNFTGIESASAVLMHKVEGPIYTDNFSRSHLALLPKPQAGRLIVARPPQGHLAITVERPRWPEDTINSNLYTLPTGHCWTIVESMRIGRIRNMWKVDNLFKADLDAELSRPSLRLAIYRHESGEDCRQAQLEGRIRNITTDN